MKKFIFCVWIEWWYNHEHEVAGFLSLALFLSLPDKTRGRIYSLPHRQLLFQSEPDQIELARAVNLFSRALKPGRQECIASLRRLPLEILNFFCPSQEEMFL